MASRMFCEDVSPVLSNYPESIKLLFGTYSGWIKLLFGTFSCARMEMAGDSRGLKGECQVGVFHVVLRCVSKRKLTYQSQGSARLIFVPFIFLHVSSSN